jgi:D-alanyl-D-alanine carboxypeptidase (penicillin-binding protein 5/6)
VIQDPTGLDDEFSVRGGNRISARDLAIAGRALLQDPLLAAIVAMPEYRFTGGDAEPHRVIGHNEFMTAYDGAVGVKTGYTKRAGSSLVAAARRDGRTYLVVVIDSTNAVAEASALLDAAFAGTLQPGGQPDVLPAVPRRTLYAGPGTGPVAATQLLQAGAPSRSASTGLGLALALGALVLAGLVIARRRRVVAIEQQRRRQAAARRATSAQRPRQRA